MNLSTNTRYAIRLLFELKKPGPPVPTALIAERIGIPLKTVERIHATLKQGGVTDGVMGVKGGILLKIPLSEISLGEMIALFDHGVHFAVCYGNKANECPYRETCDICTAWGNVSAAIQNGLNNIALGSILQNYEENSCPFSRQIAFGNKGKNV